MKLALPVFHPAAPGRVLLRAGYELDPHTLSRLAELRVRSLWIAVPELAFLLKYTSPAAIRHQAAIAGHVHTLFDRAREGVDAQVDYEAYASTVTQLIEALLVDQDAAIMIGKIARAGDAEMEHAATVCYLSTLMGIKLAWYLERQRARVTPKRARQVMPLGVAAMLHDIGMTRLSEDVRDRIRANPDPADADFRAHVEIGYDMIRGKVPATVAASVLNHHQRYDGSGFPRRTMADGRVEDVTGDQIHVHARIIAVADAFDRLSTADDGTDRPRVRVLKELLRGPRAGWFDKTVMHALLAVCPPYPPGSLVTLSNGLRGVVIGWDPRNPCRPRVQPYDPDAPETFESRPMTDLMHTPGVCVAEIDGHDVGRDNFYPETAMQFSLDAEAMQMHNAGERDRMRARADRFGGESEPEPGSHRESA